jgi:hypothetical protein
MTLDHPVLSSLLPVVLLIAIGFVAGKARLIRGEGVRDLSNLVFLVLTQALLFRTMSSVHIERLDFKSVALYYLVAGALVHRPAADPGAHQPIRRAGAGSDLQQHADDRRAAGVAGRMARPGWCSCSR